MTTAQTTLSVVPSSATTVNNLLVLCIGYRASSSNPVTGVTDSAGNTWMKAIGHQASGSNRAADIWYVPSASPVSSSGAGVTVACASPTTFVLSLFEFAGTAGVGLVDQSAAADGFSTSASSGATGTLIQSSEVAVGLIGAGTTTAFGVGSGGFTGETQLISNVTGAIWSIVPAYQVTSGTAAVTLQSGSLGSSNVNWAAAVATFRAPSTVSTGPATESLTTVDTFARVGSFLRPVTEQIGPTMKALLTGLADRANSPAAGYYPAVSIRVCNVNWSDLQPTEMGPLTGTTSPDTGIYAIADAVSWAQSTGGKVKVRIFCGANAPTYALGKMDSLATIGSPFTICDQVASAFGTVGAWWTSGYIADYQDLMTKVAAAYDTTPEIVDIAVTGASTISRSRSCVKQATRTRTLPTVSTLRRST